MTAVAIFGALIRWRVRQPAGPQTVVVGNRIGTDKAGTVALGNLGSGILIDSDGRTMHDRRVRGGGGQPDRVQPEGRRDAVRRATTPGRPQRHPGELDSSRNSRRGLGIDLNDDGPTQNYVGKITADHLVPGAQPESRTTRIDRLVRGDLSHGGTNVSGSLHSTRQHRVHASSSSPTRPPTRPRAAPRSGIASVTTDANGDANFALHVSGVVPVGEVVTATATDPAGSTSEVSRPGFQYTDRWWTVGRR